MPAALAVAEELRAALAPFCQQIAVAGSLRRRKPTVGDVEILFVPRFEARPFDMFTTATVDLADEALAGFLAAGVLAKRGGWGALNKFATHLASGIGVDFFTEPNPADWFRSLVIRTGPKDSNIRLIESAARRGLHVHAYGPGITNARGEAVAVASEREFFEICGAAYAEPEARA